MMSDLGHQIYLYGGEENEARCFEHITCITREQMPDIEPCAWPEDKYFQLFNENAIREISFRVEPHDFICLIGGHAQRSIAEAFSNNLCVEHLIGYPGCFANYKVFCSHAWQNLYYGGQSGPDIGAVDGRFYDTVIPHMIDIDEFPFVEDKDDYFLFIGRLIDRKGYRIAQQVCEKLNLKLKVAGAGEFNGYGEHVGIVGPKERGELMSHAKAVFVPTIYVEPFGLTMVESFACGTPVISTDFGSFPELNKNGVTGFRCHSIGEFMAATKKVEELDPKTIRQYAVDNFSMEVIGPQYETYFKRLETLWDLGFYNEGDFA